MAQTIDARVKQKTGTAADFAGYTLLAGEIALVRTSENGPVWNFKVGPGNFDSLDWSLQNPGAAQEADTSTVFPAGVPGLYIPTESGTYDGVSVDLSVGYVQLIWDGSALVKAEFPIDLAGYATKTEIEEEQLVTSETVIKSPQIIDKSLINQGQILTTTGNDNESANWLNTGRQPFDSADGQGEQYTLSGFGSVGSSGVNGRIFFYDSANTYMPGETILGSNILDPVTFTRPVGAMYFAINVVNTPGIGPTPDQSPFYNTIMLERGTSASPVMDKGFFLDGSKLINFTSEFDLTEVVLRKPQTARSIFIYFHNGGAKDIWFRVRLTRQNSPSIFTNLWRMDEAYIVRRTGDFDFEDITQVVATGVWENAIYTTTGGYTDALGSAHGCEMFEDVSFFIDGEQFDLDTTIRGQWKCRAFEVYQSSFLKTADGAGDVGKMTKQWTFKSGRVEIMQTLYWLATLGIANNSYLGMCSIYRINPTSDQITHTAMANEEWKPYDVSSPGFTTPIYTNNSDPSRMSMVVWGDRIKVQMTAEIREPVLPNQGMYVQNVASPNYNKMYNRFGSTTVNNGDIWRSKTVYDISVK